MPASRGCTAIANGTTLDRSSQSRAIATWQLRKLSYSVAHEELIPNPDQVELSFDTENGLWQAEIENSMGAEKQNTLKAMRA